MAACDWAYLQEAIVHAEDDRQQPYQHWGCLATPLKQWVRKATPAIVGKEHGCIQHVMSSHPVAVLRNFMYRPLGWHGLSAEVQLERCMLHLQGGPADFPSERPYGQGYAI